MKRWTILIAAVGLVGAFFVGASLRAQSNDREAKRVATIEDIMKALHRTHVGELRKALDAVGTEDDAWERVGHHAAMMNESGHILTQSGRAIDQVWLDGCAALREGTEKIAAAAKSEQIDDARAGLKTMMSSCRTCHSEHRN